MSSVTARPPHQVDVRTSAYALDREAGQPELKELAQLNRDRQQAEMELMQDASTKVMAMTD